MVCFIVLLCLVVLYPTWTVEIVALAASLALCYLIAKLWFQLNWKSPAASEPELP